MARSTGYGTLQGKDEVKTNEGIELWAPGAEMHPMNLKQSQQSPSLAWKKDTSFAALNEQHKQANLGRPSLEQSVTCGNEQHEN